MMLFELDSNIFYEPISNPVSGTVFNVEECVEEPVSRVQRRHGPLREMQALLKRLSGPPQLGKHNYQGLDINVTQVVLDDTGALTDAFPFFEPYHDQLPPFDERAMAKFSQYGEFPYIANRASMIIIALNGKSNVFLILVILILDVTSCMIMTEMTSSFVGNYFLWSELLWANWNQKNSRITSSLQ
ncbi:hypothetical protein B7463_g7273, partial [Scytalidium lignicola]